MLLFPKPGYNRQLFQSPIKQPTHYTRKGIHTNSTNNVAQLQINRTANPLWLNDLESHPLVEGLQSEASGN